MKKTIALTVIAILLIVIGGGIFIGGMSMADWDFKKLSTSKYVNNVYEISDGFKDICVETDTAKVEIIPSQTDKVSVECFENEKSKHEVAVVEGVLTIKISDQRKWYEKIGINFHTTKITINIPSGEYGNLKVQASTGDIKTNSAFNFNSVDISTSTGSIKCLSSATESVTLKATTGSIYTENVSAKNLSISVSTGKVLIKNVNCSGDVNIKVSTGETEVIRVNCKNFYTSGTTGDIELYDVIATEKISVERDTGDVEFERCDGAELFFETSTGDVEGSLLTSKVFHYDTDTGRVNVPKTTTGGLCEIYTDTGDISITIRA